MTSNPQQPAVLLGTSTRTPAGTLIQLPNTTISAYIAKPPSTSSHLKKAILFIPDVLGIWQNNQLLADRFASAGYLVLMPDIYNGDPYKLQIPFAIIEPTNAELGAWATHGSDGTNPHTTEHIDPIVSAAISYLDSHHGMERLGAVGYCLGAKYVVRFLNNLKDKDKIDVGFVAHPSFITEDELWVSRGPLHIAAAEKDLIFTRELRRQTEEILEKKGGVWSIALHGGVAHGFAVRGDPEGKVDRWAQEEAFGQAVRFFEAWL